MLDGEMTDKRFEALIIDVLSEMKLPLRIFAIDHVQKKAGVWAASLSGKKGPEAEVSVDTSIYNTGDLVKQESRRQLTNR